MILPVCMLLLLYIFVLERSKNIVGTKIDAKHIFWFFDKNSSHKDKENIFQQIKKPPYEIATRSIKILLI